MDNGDDGHHEGGVGQACFAARLAQILQPGDGRLQALRLLGRLRFAIDSGTPAPGQRRNLFCGHRLHQGQAECFRQDRFALVGTAAAGDDHPGHAAVVGQVLHGAGH